MSLKARVSGRLHKIRQFASALWSDTGGVILPYVTVMLPVIVGVSCLALDGARLMSLHTQLQNEADALALAAAAELDRLPDAETRARRAIERLLAKQTLFGAHSNRKNQPAVVQFYSRLPAKDSEPMSGGTLASGPESARFVSVAVHPVAFSTILPTAFVGGANSTISSASAVAGFDQVVCGVTPIYVCNPFEAPGMTYEHATEMLQLAAVDKRSQSRLIRLRQYDGNAPYTAADYGFLDVPALTRDEADLVDSLAVQRPAACLMQRAVNFRRGFAKSVREGFNVRFDLYENSMSEKNKDNNYPPAQNVRKGYVLPAGGVDEKDNFCSMRRGSNWPIGSPPEQVTGLPLDRTWAPDNARIGEGDWDLETYWQVNHGGGFPVKDNDLPSRYYVYRFEIEQGLIGDVSQGGESGAPVCYSGGGTRAAPDRRILHAAIINCQSLRLVGDAQSNIPVAAFGKLFLTLPLAQSQTDLYVELVGLVQPGDGVSYDVVQLYR